MTFGVFIFSISMVSWRFMSAEIIIGPKTEFTILHERSYNQVFTRGRELSLQRPDGVLDAQFPVVLDFGLFVLLFDL